MIAPSLTIWLTGLPSSGKSTLGVGLQSELELIGVNAVLLDGDEVRKSICADLGFSEEDRTENIRRIASMARLLNHQGLCVVCCFVSPMASMRSMARDIVGANHFFEVFVDAEISVCRQRDVKGLYQKASQGLVSNLTGISAPYERPVNPNLRIDTVALSQHQALELLLKNVRCWLQLSESED